MTNQTSYQLTRTRPHRAYEARFWNTRHELFQMTDGGHVWNTTPHTHGLTSVLDVQQFFEYRRGISTVVVTKD
jgi:hypothetical protein